MFFLPTPAPCIALSYGIRYVKQFLFKQFPVKLVRLGETYSLFENAFLGTKSTNNTYLRNFAGNFCDSFCDSSKSITAKKRVKQEHTGHWVCVPACHRNPLTRVWVNQALETTVAASRARKSAFLVYYLLNVVYTQKVDREKKKKTFRSLEKKIYLKT